MSIETMDAIELQYEAEDYFNGLSYRSYLSDLSELFNGESEGVRND